MPRQDRDQINHYANNLKDELFRDRNAVTLELARTPLLCSLICLVFLLQKGRLPKSRRQLYEYSTELLIELRDRSRRVPPGPEFENFDFRRKLKKLKHVALIMQEGSKSVDVDQTIEVPKKSVISWLSNYLKNQSVLGLDAEDYLEFLIDRCSIIREPSFGRIDFVHRSFMEYLAADELVSSREIFQVQEKILFDEWQNTLQFCMSTKTGGAYYGGELIRNIVEFVDEDNKLKDKRRVLLKVLSLLNFVEEVPEIIDSAIKRACSIVFPPLSEAEVSDLVGIPIRILESIINYEKISLIYTESQLAACTEILCQHEDEDSRKVLLTGYQRIDDREIIKKINHSEKLNVAEHHALIQRLRNRSYTDPVYLTTEELSDQKLRSAGLRSVWIKFPSVGDNFVGWDYCSKCSEVRFLNVSQNDLRIIEKSVKVWKFDNCRSLNRPGFAGGGFV